MSSPKESIKESVKRAGKGHPKKVQEDVEELAENVVGKGKLLKDAMGLSDEMLEGIYTFAYRLYTLGKYDESLQMFRLLIMLNPMESKYTLGLAACFHMQKDYRSAASSYSLCSMIDPGDPMPYYHASDCYMNMDKPELAVDALRKCIERCGEGETHQQVKNRAEVTLSNIAGEKKKEAK